MLLKTWRNSLETVIPLPFFFLLSPFWCDGMAVRWCIWSVGTRLIDSSNPWEEWSGWCFRSYDKRIAIWVFSVWLYGVYSHRSNWYWKQTDYNGTNSPIGLWSSNAVSISKPFAGSSMSLRVLAEFVILLRGSLSVSMIFTCMRGDTGEFCCSSNELQSWCLFHEGDETSSFFDCHAILLPLFNRLIVVRST